MTNPVKAVIFDLFETLVTEGGAPLRSAAKLGPDLGLDVAAYKLAWRGFRHRVVRGEVPFREALVAIASQLNSPIEPAAAQRLCDERAREKAAVFERIDPELLQVVRTLRQQGVPLALISNCFAEDVLAWPDCELAPHFACTVFSCAAGMAKPDPDIYLEAIRRLNATPAHALFIGDGGDDELAGAERAGLRAAQAAWFVNREHRFTPTAPRLSHPSELLRLLDAR